LNRDEYNKLKIKTDLDANYVVRALPIAAMIPSYGSILMNPFLNDLIILVTILILIVLFVNFL